MSQRTQVFAAQVRVARAFGGKQRRRRMPRQARPAAIVRAYAAALLSLVRRLHEAYAPLLAALPRIAAAATAARRTDGNEDDEARRALDAAAARMSETMSTADLDALAARFARETSTFQRLQFVRQVRAVVGADIFTADRTIPALVDGFTAENAALIKDLPRSLERDVAGIVTRGIQAATPHDALAVEIEATLAVSEERARLIANDQVGKLYGQINASRQQELGITRFTWRTSRDSRVRGTPKSLGGRYPKATPSHYDRDGRVYSYSDPPKGRDGKPELPGQPIRCRCNADPVFDDVLDDLGDSV